MAFGTQHSTNIQAIHTRKHKVQDDQVRSLLARQLQRPQTVEGRRYSVAILRQICLDQIDYVLVIIHD